MPLTELRPDKRQTPHDIIPGNYPRLFLAGSIEMGKAAPWQAQFVNELKSYDVVVLNPRRLDWDSSWEQNIRNEKFAEQVLWEQKALFRANCVLIYFQEDTMSPISLLELGQIAMLSSDKSVIVCCPKKFWKSGNVQITCALHKLFLYEDLEDAKAHVKVLLRDKSLLL